MLKTFCDLVATAMQPGDLFGRIGGEEFACLLPDVVMAEALRRAEQVRRAFEATLFADLAMRHTVSIGVTATTEAGCDLSALLATADRALYRAKAEGRNRVAPAPPVLVERSAGPGPRWAAEIAAPAVVAPPLAG
jgi:diguanylate cyclase (GGDEF)-like protein